MKNIFFQKIPTRVIFLIVIICIILSIFLQEGITTSTVSKTVGAILVVSIIFGFVGIIEKRGKTKEISSDINITKKSSEKEEEFEKQTQQYDSLGITESVRGQIALFIVGSLILSIVLGFFNLSSFTLQDALYSLIIYLPLAFFIYKGHRWAMVVMMVLWTFEKGYQVSTLSMKGGLWITFLWWILLLTFLYRAIKIENARKKRVIQKPVINSGVPPVFQDTEGESKALSTDKMLKNSLAIGTIIVSLSIAFYLVYFLPSRDRNKEASRKECVDQAMVMSKEKYARELESARNNTDTAWRTIVEGSHSRNEQGYSNADYDSFLKRCFTEKGLTT